MSGKNSINPFLGSVPRPLEFQKHLQKIQAQTRTKNSSAFSSVTSFIKSPIKGLSSLSNKKFVLGAVAGGVGVAALATWYFRPSQSQIDTQNELEQCKQNLRVLQYPRVSSSGSNNEWDPYLFFGCLSAVTAAILGYGPARKGLRYLMKPKTEFKPSTIDPANLIFKSNDKRILDFYRSGTINSLQKFIFCFNRFQEFYYKDYVLVEDSKKNDSAIPAEKPENNGSSSGDAGASTEPVTKRGKKVPSLDQSLEILNKAAEDFDHDPQASMLANQTYQIKEHSLHKISPLFNIYDEAFYEFAESLTSNVEEKELKKRALLPSQSAINQLVSVLHNVGLYKKDSSSFHDLKEAIRGLRRFDWSAHYDDLPLNSENYPGTITVTNQDTLSALEELRKEYNKEYTIAFLDMGHSQCVAGGHQFRSKIRVAQEESLSLHSNMAHVLSSLTDSSSIDLIKNGVRLKYAEKNRIDLNTNVAFDATFRTDSGKFKALCINAPSANFSQINKSQPSSDLSKISTVDEYSKFLKEDPRAPENIKRNLEALLKTAIAKRVDVLILGATGCGAFQHNPVKESKLWKTLLIDEGYAEYFQEVRFAILPDDSRPENFRAFKEAFKGCIPPASNAVLPLQTHHNKFDGWKYRFSKSANRLKRKMNKFLKTMDKLKSILFSFSYNHATQVENGIVNHVINFVNTYINSRLDVYKTNASLSYEKELKFLEALESVLKKEISPESFQDAAIHAGIKSRGIAPELSSSQIDNMGSLTGEDLENTQMKCTESRRQLFRNREEELEAKLTRLCDNACKILGKDTPKGRELLRRQFGEDMSKFTLTAETLLNEIPTMKAELENYFAKRLIAEVWDQTLTSNPAEFNPDKIQTISTLLSKNNTSTLYRVQDLEAKLMTLQNFLVAKDEDYPFFSENSKGKGTVEDLSPSLNDNFETYFNEYLDFAAYLKPSFEDRLVGIEESNASKENVELAEDLARWLSSRLNLFYGINNGLNYYDDILKIIKHIKNIERLNDEKLNALPFFINEAYSLISLKLGFGFQPLRVFDNKFALNQCMSLNNGKVYTYGLDKAVGFTNVSEGINFIPISKYLNATPLSHFVGVLGGIKCYNEPSRRWEIKDKKIVLTSATEYLAQNLTPFTLKSKLLLIHDLLLAMSNWQDEQTPQILSNSELAFTRDRGGEINSLTLLYNDLSNKEPEKSGLTSNQLIGTIVGKILGIQMPWERIKAEAEAEAKAKADGKPLEKTKIAQLQKGCIKEFNQTFEGYIHKLGVHFSLDDLLMKLMDPASDKRYYPKDALRDFMSSNPEVLKLVEERAFAAQ